MAGRADTPIRLNRLQFLAASTNLHFSRGGKGLGRWHPPTCNGAHTWILNEPRGGIGPLLRPQPFPEIEKARSLSSATKSLWGKAQSEAPTAIHEN